DSDNSQRQPESHDQEMPVPMEKPETAEKVPLQQSERKIIKFKKASHDKEDVATKELPEPATETIKESGETAFGDEPFVNKQKQNQNQHPNQNQNGNQNQN